MKSQKWKGMAVTQVHCSAQQPTLDLYPGPRLGATRSMVFSFYLLAAAGGARARPLPST